MMHLVTHSAGLVLTDHDPGHSHLSFRVDADGVHELLGWGHAGPMPAFALNPPPNPQAVHTVLVEHNGSLENGIDPAVLVGVRSLIEEHSERYAGCQIFLSVGVHRDLVNWAAVGCPEPELAAVPTDAELAAAAATEVRTADQSFFDEAPERAEPVSAEVVEADAKASIEAKVAAAKAAHEKAALQARLDELQVSYDGRWGVPRLTELLEEALAGVEETEGDDGERSPDGE